MMQEPQIDEREQQAVPTKLSLNLTYPALVALIGGDTEAEVHIRHQIMNRFAEAYLKPLVNSKVFQDSYNTLLTGLNQEIAETIGKRKTAFYNSGVELAPDVAAALKVKAKQMLEDGIEQAFAAAMKDIEARCGPTIEAYLDKRIDVYVNQMVKDKIDKKLKQLIS